MVGHSTSNGKAEHVYNRSRSHRTDSHDEKEGHLCSIQGRRLGLVAEDFNSRDCT